MSNTIGRITLFQVESDAINAPKYKGYMETQKGRYYVSLWEEPNEKVTGGWLLKGQVKDEKDNR